MNANLAATIADADSEILLRVVNRIAIVTLNRPQSLNALTLSMIRTLSDVLEHIRNDDAIAALIFEGAGEKGFCAGGDVRTLYEHARCGDKLGEMGWQRFFAEEYRLDYELHTFGKPVVALLDGITMGGGMGLGQAANLRIVTTRTKMAMPETRIGLLPDVGATHFLASLPPEMALYLGLTGATLGGGDAVQVGLADLCVPADTLKDLDEKLLRVRFDGDVLASLRSILTGYAEVQSDSKSALGPFSSLIMRHFKPGARVADVIASLHNAMDSDPSSDERDWLRRTLDSLLGCSPTMQLVTREALVRGKQMSLAQCFRMELGIITRAVEEGDFCEGVRAHLIDKDRNPHWEPSNIETVPIERVSHFLTSPWQSDAHPLADLGC
ncbi:MULTISPECIES: enoyl-CoA hydratase/isomerase family protein [Burkholderia cepacia complex]|uniref:enoyl-CoA hydratase/isomerase family protein n=1 Tax=Burkholderia cepacia complex TaxID=87882 RepID=UPI001CF33331|nr:MULTISPECIES: enoyl-CoA hydratase/isomerase family protein [Burkholderia cepacia complex]MCA8057416.1 enoyl-CoA hydratase/isomerase family protein [Burkholderia cepacia]MDN7535271.1 enoyl-CoA hydratase/isomerase family protein [Burkholderia orbicola]